MTVLDRLRWPIIFLAAIWGIQLVNGLSGYMLNNWFGLLPRTFRGLDGILFMPLLHGSLAHAAANTIPIVVLGSLVVATAPRVAMAATTIIVMLGGIAVWLLGKTAIHIGASGLIFGWFGFLLVRGLVEKRAIPLLIAIAIVVLYGGMFWGVLPGQPGVSWEAHLFGFIAGAAAAVLLRSGR